MIIPLAEAVLVGRRLERLVVDRRFDQLVVFLGRLDADGVELVYHRTDVARLDLGLLEGLASRRRAILASSVSEADGWLIHRLEIESADSVEVWCREANVVVGTR